MMSYYNTCSHHPVFSLYIFSAIFFFFLTVSERELSHRHLPKQTSMLPPPLTVASCSPSAWGRQCLSELQNSRTPELQQILCWGCCSTIRLPLGRGTLADLVTLPKQEGDFPSTPQGRNNHQVQREGNHLHSPAS